MGAEQPREREEIDHVKEARAWLDARDLSGREYFERPSIDEGANVALVHATLALVEAQREANEQARIANRIALAQPVDLPGGGEVRHDIHKVEYGNFGNVSSVQLDPEIARVLGIGATMSEIPIEKMPAALAARLDCPVASCNGVVRLGLLNGSIGDQAGWACDLNDYHQWREDGKPRWAVELPVSVYLAEVKHVDQQTD